MKQVICCVDPTIPLLAEALQPVARVHCIPGAELSSAVLKRLHCHALLVRSSTRVNAELLTGTSVRFVGSASSGIDHIAIEELQAMGIAVAHTPGCNANAVAEYVIIALLMWALLWKHPLSSIRLGIVGFGHIGRRVAHYAHRLGVHVYVNDPPLARQGFSFPEWVTYVPGLPELCAICSALTLHVPLTHNGPDATWHLVDTEELNLLGPNSLIIQTSRGGVLNESALERTLEYKPLSIALDVWEQEPLVNRTLALRALLATPHIAGHTWQARVRCSQTLAHRFAEWAEVELSDAPFIEALADIPPPPAVPWDDPEALLHLLQQRRRLHEDSQALRAWSSLPVAGQRQAFRSFRESYPRRYETLTLLEFSSPPRGQPGQ